VVAGTYALCSSQSSLAGTWSLNLLEQHFTAMAGGRSAAPAHIEAFELDDFPATTALPQERPELVLHMDCADLTGALS
jgi:hypothetical protein